MRDALGRYCYARESSWAAVRGPPALPVLTTPVGSMSTAWTELAVGDEEQLVGVLVGVPSELALELDHLDLVVVEPGHRLGRPVLGEQRELLGDVNRSVGHVSSIAGHPLASGPAVPQVDPRATQDQSLGAEQSMWWRRQDPPGYGWPAKCVPLAGSVGAWPAEAAAHLVGECLQRGQGS